MNDTPDKAVGKRPSKLLSMAALWVGFVLIGYLLVRFLPTDPSRDLREPPPINVHAIDIEMPDLNGESVTLGDFKDGPMIINFWGTWCPPCLREIPLLIALQAEHAQSGLTVVGIALDDAQAVIEFVEDMQVNYPVLLGEDNGMAVSDAVGVDILALPISVFVGRDGLVTRLHSGEIDRADAEHALAEILPPLGR